ncbi:hypothetical protein [Rhizobium leguminosarum]|uniref:hypothetical protein n=1 Tax=Rhizobium leguminosarum TaxID=384 RepID=UPI0003A734AD|nr:hypothetical protein [Rhizobium leguminosarum]
MSKKPIDLPGAAIVPPVEARDIIDIWKYVVSVQMHFNDMEMKVRNLFFTIIAAMLGLIGVSQGKSVLITLAEEKYVVSSLILIFISMIPITLLFYFIDRFWYHRLLVGAVKKCIEIESAHKTLLPEISLGEAISRESPVGFPMWTRWLFFFVREKRFRQSGQLHSDGKIELLYKSVITVAVLLALTFGWFGGVTPQPRPKVNCVLAALLEKIEPTCQRNK